MLLSLLVVIMQFAAFKSEYMVDPLSDQDRFTVDQERCTAIGVGALAMADSSRCALFQ
jgi:hypothetical protein